MIKISVLVDNDSVLPATKHENGLSLHIDLGKTQILFDTGNKFLLENVHRLGVDLTRITHVVLSHGHYDHSSGLPDLLEYFKNRHIEHLPTLVCHPCAFDRRGIMINVLFFSIWLRALHAPLTKEQVTAAFPTIFSDKPFWITPSCVFLGEIPRDAHGDEESVFGKVEKDQKWVSDHIVDDSALVIKTDRGLIIILGCAHSGICNTIEYAKKVCADNRIVDVVGGFHLKHSGPWKLKHVIQYLRKTRPQHIHACHCTGWAKKLLPYQQNIGVGTILSYTRGLI